MKGEERSPLHRLGGIVLGVFLLPGVVAVATEYWLQGEGDVTSRHVGLWKTCGETTCVALSSDVIPEWLSAVRGLCVMALCLHVISVATGCCCARLGSHEMNTFSFIPRVEEGSAVTAGFFMTGGLAVFARASQTHPEFRHLHFDWSFWLCLTHVCVLILCGSVIAIARDDCACRKHRCCLPGKRASANHKVSTKRPKRTSQHYYHHHHHHPQEVSKTVDLSWGDPGLTKSAEPGKKCQTTIVFYDMSAVGCADGTSDRGDLMQVGHGCYEGEKYFSSCEGIPHLLNTISGQGKEHSVV